MATDQEIGARLRRARQAARFATAADAARALGMKYPTYVGHENGSRGLRANLERYSRKFRVSVEWLLTEKGQAPAGSIVGLDSEPNPQEDMAVILRRVSDWQRSDPAALRELREFADGLRSGQSLGENDATLPAKVS